MRERGPEYEAKHGSSLVPRLIIHGKGLDTKSISGFHGMTGACTCSGLQALLRVYIRGPGDQGD